MKKQIKVVKGNKMDTKPKPCRPIFAS